MKQKQVAGVEVIERPCAHISLTGKVTRSTEKIVKPYCGLCFDDLPPLET